MSESRPPQLIFDDGSRIIQESQQVEVINDRKASNTTLLEYYEVDRLVREIKQLKFHGRVALQFPDELIEDAPEVTWLFEKFLPESLVFVLGDTTYAPCCPDRVAAAHLQADCLVHYGHACLSPCNEIPVLYSFGKSKFDVDKCVEQIRNAIMENSVQKILLFYQVDYHHQVDSLQTALNEMEDIEVTKAEIPRRVVQTAHHRKCTENDNCCSSSTAQTNVVEEGDGNVSIDEPLLSERLVIGGLEIPTDFDYSDVTLLYIGDDSSRQYLNMILRFLSHQSIHNYWCYDPPSNQLKTTLSASFQRQLNRRFYLVQRARNLSVFGILVANLSDHLMRRVVKSLRDLLEFHGRTSYTFCVGKINPAKLANFAEIEAFILVACPEHSLLDNERDFPVPVITPLELSVALGTMEWGKYSLDPQTFLDQSLVPTDVIDHDDAPYFSMVTGQYESVPTKERNLQALPGQGQLTTYTSAASHFLHGREYQGLDLSTPTPAQPAVLGQEGIASNYGDR